MRKRSFYRSFFHLSQPFFVTALVSFVAGAFIGGAISIPGHSSYDLWKDQGSALGGLLTLGAGVLAYYAGSRQALATKDQLDDLRANRDTQARAWLLRTKAALPLPLIELHDYARSCFTSIEAVLKEGFHDGSHIVNRSLHIPKNNVPSEVIQRLNDVLIYCAEADQQCILFLLSFAQIQNSRIESMRQRVAVLSRQRPVPLYEVVSCLHDTLKIVGWGNACLVWARGAARIIPPSNSDLARLPELELDAFPACRARTGALTQ